MGKSKKPCKNAYHFFIMSEKKKHEDQGNRIDGNFQTLSNAFGGGWGKMTKEERAPYEKMAKEAKEQDKCNFNNKFTGGSYAPVHEKQRELNWAEDLMEEFIHQLVSGPGAGDRMIIFMKAVYSVEEIIDRKTRQYWPSELAMVAFSLKGGIKAIHTQLVDTKETPTGYASQAKENCEETLLPMPGNEKLLNDECRDYLKIVRGVTGFANYWLKDGYDIPGHRKVVFALDAEREPITSCLQWLVNQLPIGPQRDKYEFMVSSMKVFKISKLILHMAAEAHAINENYKLGSEADQIVTKGNYDYREEIACGYHRLDFASLKMHNCAQSIVMRRAYLLFEEFVPAFKYSFTERHRINGVGKSFVSPIIPIIEKKREASPVEEEVTKVEEPMWLKSDDIGTSMASGTTYPPSHKWGSPAPASFSYEEYGLSALGATGGSSSRDAASTLWERRPSSSSCVPSPSPPLAFSSSRFTDDVEEPDSWVNPDEIETFDYSWLTSATNSPPSHKQGSGRQACGSSSRDASSSTLWERRTFPSSSFASRSPPQPFHSPSDFVSALSCSSGTGRGTKASSGWFDKEGDQHPSLGRQASFIGRGSSRGTPGVKRSFMEDDDDEDYPPLGTSRGRGREGF